ncbi:MAG: Hsp20/alpha crystallin family protein [Chloroflexota bacterium]|nr:Hsp20/alpha crystallin family protein [Chloroflexota bacterium]
MSSTRWDPLNDLVSLREAMNNLLEESFVRPRGGGSGGGAGAGSAPAGLPVDIRETPEAFVLRASVPGVRPEDVDLTVLGDTLRITGRHREVQEQNDPNERWLIRERRFGAFERTVRLPTAVDSGAAEADFKDGVLTVTLPKAEVARPRSIPVRPGQGARPAAVEAASGDSEQLAEGQPS